MNKSQKIISGTIISGRLGIPNLEKIFTEEIIKIAMENTSPIMIYIISFAKILLVLCSVWGLIELLKNIELQYRTKNEKEFFNYFIKLIVTGLIIYIALDVLLRLT
jgi:hypothetical protein